MKRHAPALFSRALLLAAAAALVLAGCESGGDGGGGYDLEPGANSGGGVPVGDPVFDDTSVGGGGDDTPDETGDGAGDETGDETGDATGDETGDQTGDETGDATGDDTGHGTGDETGGFDGDWVDPSCIDGEWDEVLPDPDGDITSLKSSYSAADVEGFVLGILDVRYPIGAYLVEGALQDQSWGHCIDVFLGNSSSANAVIGQLSTFVHECGHFLDISTGGFWNDAYVITETLTLTCQEGSTPDNGGGKTFARSLINTDEFSELHPPCESFGGGFGCDSYAAIYLDGDPNNAQFEGGDQGFNSLLEETVQYVNSLATDYAFEDHVSGSVSARDGILTFLWYVQRYLRMARMQYPQAYDLLTSACWREVILTTWGRAWLYLDLTDGKSKLGIDDDFLYELATDPVLLQEIQLLRDAEGCP